MTIHLSDNVYENYLVSSFSLSRYNEYRTTVYENKTKK